MNSPVIHDAVPSQYKPSDSRDSAISTSHTHRGEYSQLFCCDFGDTALCRTRGHAHRLRRGRQIVLVVIERPFQAYENEVYLLSEGLDEQAAKMHFLAFGTKLNVATQTQAACTGSRLKALLKAHKNDVYFLPVQLDELDLLRCWKETAACETHVYLLTKQRHKKVAILQLPALGAALAALVQEHAVHVRVEVEGPFKSGHHRC